MLFAKNKNAAAAGLWKKPVRGKGGKPKSRFSSLPTALGNPAQTRGIPTFPTAPTAAGISTNLTTHVGVGPKETIERGQIKLTKAGFTNFRVLVIQSAFESIHTSRPQGSDPVQ